MKIASKLTVVFLIFSFLTALMGFALLKGIGQTINPIKKELSKIFEEQVTAQILQSLAKDIIYYDEVLTQSVRNYAYTKDKKWENHYKATDPKLENVIRRAIELGDKTDKEIFSNIEISNLALVNMEYQSIDLVNNGLEQEAVKILDSEEYARQKAIYKEGIEAFYKRKAFMHGSAVAHSFDIRFMTQEKISQLKTTSERVVMIFILLSLIASFLLSHFCSKYISDPIEKFRDFADKIGQGNLEVSVEILKKDEIGALAISFNQMVSDLKQVTISKDYLDSIIENINDCLIVTDAEGNIRTVNKAVFTRLGYSKEQLIGSNITALVPLKEYFNKDDSIEKMRSQYELINYESICQTKEGKAVPVLLGASVIKSKQDKVDNIIFIIKDISELKKTESALSESQALMRIAGNLAKIGGWSVNLAENKVIWSDEIAEIHEMPIGYSPTVEEGINFYAPEYREKIKQVYFACAKNGIGYSEELQIITKTGRRVWVLTIGEAVKDNSGNIINVRGAFQDISERRKMEEDLKDGFIKLNESRSVLNRVIDLLPIRIFWKDKNLRYLGCNKVFANDAGKETTDQLIGQDDYAMGWREQADRYRADDMEVIQSKKEKLNIEEPQTTPKGDVIWLSTNKVPLTDEQGNVIGILGSYADVTERKKEEMKLNILLKDLKQFKEVTIDRENRMIELKKEINRLSAELGRPEPYDLSFLRD